MILWGFVNLKAQITLHEATNVTQTKATLSADFPDLNSEHGFQYKYGTLPEIDEFSKVALAPSSDPVQITTSENAWSARTVKGWVESNSDLSVGQTSVMSAYVNFSEPTTITFEWSVDSEENIGILSFMVDGKTVREISGSVDFTEVSYQATEGKHTLQWQYKKTSTTNIGLDLGKVRNIDLQNTTDGEWIQEIVSTSELFLSKLYPNENYIYRAFSNDEYSTIGQFRTTNVFVNMDNTPFSSITQTSAKYSSPSVVIDTDNIITNVSFERNIDEVENALIKPNIYLSNMSYENWRAGEWNGGGSLTMAENKPNAPRWLKVSFEAAAESSISFRYRGGSSKTNNNGLKFYIDGIEHEFYTYYNGVRKGNYIVPKGKHTLKWEVVQKDVSVYCEGIVCDLDITNTIPVYSKQYEIKGKDSNELFFNNLLPNTTYKVQATVTPDYISPLSIKWKKTSTDWITFTTLPVTAELSSCENIKQGSVTIRGKVDGGDATIIATGLQYKDVTGSRWTDYPKVVTETELTQNITRLKPNTTYNYRSYLQAQDCDTVFSEIGEFTTLAVEALKPTAIRIAQHEAELQGRVHFGDASIYQRGMQFRKSGETAWEEVEDGGNDSIYTLVKKNLEMGAKYETRTYIQPAGCDVIYSDILEFTTLNSYFVNCNSNGRTQISVTFAATLTDVDEDIPVEQYGFEYFIDSDGFFESADSYVKSDICDVPVIPNGKELKTTITGLCPSLRLKWRAYALAAGNKIYFSGIRNNEWNYAWTDRATIKVSLESATQTSIVLKLDATQDGDAHVSQIEYALANSVQDTEAYSICGNTLTINNLEPGKQYNIRFRGTVNDRVCPLLKDTSWDYSWFEYQTLPITVDVKFSNITQTKANMKVEVNSGDAPISGLRYRIGYGEITQCQETNLLTNLIPDQTYSVTIYANVNGKEMTWSANASDAPFKFTTKSVSSYVSISDISQTSAKIKCSSNYGDATYISSGLELGSLILNSESQDFEKVLTELLPGQSYSCRSFVETEEGGRVYSQLRTFTTMNIECETLPVSNISNRSATMNGTIECDSYSSAEFGFQWKQMEGWASDPAFTKGRKLDDGTISVALVNGMLEPNTDYQYRAAVRYQDHIYYAPNWTTFRTESEFIYYPASVYTVFRTDRENNALVLCGYYVAGSESVVSQGYEYWQIGNSSIQTKAPQSPVIIYTDDSMQHEFAPGELPNGNYNVRAFVKTESGNTIYGATLGFTSSTNGYSGVEIIESDLPYIVAEGGVVKVYNANQLDCVIHSVNGQILAHRTITDSYDEFRLTTGNYIIVLLSNGLREKIKI